MAPEYAYKDPLGDVYLKVGSKLFLIPHNPLLQKSTPLRDVLQKRGKLVPTSEAKPWYLSSFNGQEIGEDAFASLVNFMYKGPLTATTRIQCVDIMDLCLTFDMPDVEDQARERLESLVDDSDPPDVYDLYEASISTLLEGLNDGKFTSEELVQAYLARIGEVKHLHAVIETNANAITQARTLDQKRKNGESLGPLHGIPIIVKANISTRRDEQMDTTAGAKALQGRDNRPLRDATVVEKLLNAGAIILGKANQSEWSYHRDNQLPNGYSGIGGQTFSPYVRNGDPLGSSSGSGVCSAIGLAAASLGTETFGSIVSPGSRNNVVGIKPTLGLTSRAGVIPISSHRDSVGPMTRTVEDAAIILSVIAGFDPRDDFTFAQPNGVPQYKAALNDQALKGKKLGIPRQFIELGINKSYLNAFDKAIDILRQRGAIVEDVHPPADPQRAPTPQKLSDEADFLNKVLIVDFMVDCNKYLAGLKNPKMRSIRDVIRYNMQNPDPNNYGQDLLIKSAASQVDDDYYKALAANIDYGRHNGIDDMLSGGGFDALVLPSECDWKLSSFAGYPIISVPLGFQPGTPVDREIPGPLVKDKESPGFPFGIAFTGPRWSEELLLGLAYDFEQALRSEEHKGQGLGRLGRKAFDTAIPKTQLPKKA